MSKTRTNIDFLKNSARFPKQEVTPVSVPKVQVTKEEWNKAVKVMEQVAVNEETGKTMLRSFNSEILGQYPLIELALYDDAAEAEMTGTEITIKKVDDSADWRSYGVALPYGLTPGKAYTVKGKVKNGTSLPLNVVVTNNLYLEEATTINLYYHIAPSGTITLNATFTASANTKYIIFEPLVGTGKYVTFDLYIENEDAAMPKAQKDIIDLQADVAQNTSDIEDVNKAQDDVYTDIYGKKRLTDAVGYDNQVAITVEGETIKLKALEESTGAPHYGFKLPASLVDGERYTIKGTITNNTSTALPVGNYSSLYPDGESPRFWLAYNIPVGETAAIDYTFEYDEDYPYIVISKSNLRYVNDEAVMTLYVAQGENIVGRLEALEGDGETSVLTSTLPEVKAKGGSLLSMLNSGENTGWTITQETNGVRMVASGRAGNYTLSSIELYPEQTCEFKPGTKYGVFLDIDSKCIPLLHEQDTFDVTLFFIKSDFTQNSASFRIKQGEIVAAGGTRNLQQVTFVETGSASGPFSYVRMQISKVNNTSTTSEVANILIRRMIFFEVPSTYADYTELDFVALMKNAGDFSSLAVAAASRLRHANLLYDGLKLKSLGDSLPETISFQPLIAQTLGMKYSRDEELNDDGNYKRSTLGGSRVVPVVWNTTGGGAAGNSIYMRAKSLAHWKPDVLIILAGYNDSHAGDPYAEGGTAIVPADYGIDDAPYSGGEINLLTNPTASVPSFGASYRGMVEQILTDMPWCRLVLCGIPRGSGEVSLIGTANDWVAKKNLVIEKIAAEYGFAFVDLSKVYGVNALNYEWLTKDGLHFSDFGGKRVAMEILAKAF